MMLKTASHSNRNGLAISISAWCAVLLSLAATAGGSTESPKPSSATGAQPGVTKAIDASVYLEVERVFYGNSMWTTGSGFFVSPNGHILTNAHVVSDYVEINENGRSTLVELNVVQIRAILHPRTTREKVVLAKVVGIDRGLDLAILKTGFPPPSYVDSILNLEDVSLLQDVFVVGFPFGDLLALDSTGAPSEQGGYPEVSVTGGQITSLRKSDSGELVALQTSAEISPGNSGGPMVNPDGKLVGVVYAEISNTRQLGFAVSPNRVRRFLDRHRLDVEFVPPYVPPRRRPVAANVTFGGLSRSTPARGDIVVISEAGTTKTFELQQKDDATEWSAVIDFPWDGSNQYKTIISLRDAGGRLVGQRRILYESHRSNRSSGQGYKDVPHVIKNNRTPQDYAREQASERIADTGTVLKTDESTDFGRSSERRPAPEEDRPPVDLTGLRDQAKALYRAEAYEAAAEILQQIVREDPTDEVAREYLDLAQGKLELDKLGDSGTALSPTAQVRVSVSSPAAAAAIRIIVDGSDLPQIAVTDSRPEPGTYAVPIGHRSMTITFLVDGKEQGSKSFIREFEVGAEWALRIDHPRVGEDAGIFLVQIN